MPYPFVTVRDFTPNWGQWTPIGPIASVTRSGNVFTLTPVSGATVVRLSLLSPTCLRVRFNPLPGPLYPAEVSPAVVQRTLGAVSPKLLRNDAQALVIDTGAMQVQVELQPYRLSILRGSQVICADEPGYNLVYVPGQRVIANFKSRPEEALYCGFGEKAGAQLLKNLYTMTQFNLDNFIYSSAPLPPDNEGGPLNPSEALYASIPFMLEINPRPAGGGAPYCYGLFFDNPGQSYFNMGSNDYSDMSGKYYFGALFGDLDYYVMLGADGTASDVLAQYTTLTGRGPMPPKYALGYHQGAYGYYDRAHVEAAAQAYRNAAIPCDGLHIDVDFQDNYRTFTHSEVKFPDVAGMMAGLHSQGFKCSTNITPLLTDNPLDENRQYTPYLQRQALLQAGGLIYDTLAGQGPNPQLYRGQVSYGDNAGSNPYPYPPLRPNSAGVTPLGALGNYPDLGRADVRKVWGQQYAHLVNDVGMDMIWQDMMCPAIADAGDIPPAKTFPLDLMVNDGTNYVPDAVCHNVYSLFLLDATWNGLNALRPATRNFIIARGGYAGMQRYAGLWTGDSASSWDFLRVNLPEVLNLGLSGIPISGCDIGGFANGTGTTEPSFVAGGKVMQGITNYELLTRWMHLGAFLPWYRNHYNGYTKQFQEPWAYAEPVPTNCRKYVELRYRMLQVWYDAMYQWTQTGTPPARALFLNDPHDPQVYSHLDDQFFVGHDMLVAPILFQAETLPQPIAPQRDVYLPAGSDWYAFKDDQAPLDAPVGGGQLVLGYYAGLDLVPVYVRAGAIVPMRSLVEQYVGQLASNPLAITIYPGADSTYTMYQDDGITTAAAGGAFRLTTISHHTVGSSTQVRLQRTHDAYTPPEDHFTLRLLATPRPAAVAIGSSQVVDVGSAAALAASAGTAWYWDAGLQTTVIKVLDVAADLTVGVSFA